MVLRRSLFAGMLISLIACQVDTQQSTASLNTPTNSQALGVNYDTTDIDEDDNIGAPNEGINRINCPVGLVSDMTLDQEFGPGTANITRCLHNSTKIKVVYQINKACKNADCSKPYALGNINNAIKDYEITHGLQAGLNYEVVAIIHSKGYLLTLDNNAATPHAETNPFQAEVQALLDQGVKIYFCQNTARNNNVQTANLMPDIHYVTGGVTALADYQLNGYAMVQP